MISITDGASLSRALRLPIDLRIKRRLIIRRDQLGGEIDDQARFVVMQPGDSLRALQSALGYSVFENPVDGTRFGETDFSPGFEWLSFDGHLFEMTWILDDSGYAHVIIIPDSPMQNRDLRELCLTYAEERAD